MAANGVTLPRAILWASSGALSLPARQIPACSSPISTSRTPRQGRLDYGFGGRFDGPAPPTIGGTPLWSRVCSRVGLKSFPNIGLTLYPEHPQLVGGAPLSRWSRTRARGLPQSFPAVAKELQPPITRHASKPTANRWIITPSMSFVVATHERNGARTDAIKSTFSGGPPT